LQRLLPSQLPDVSVNDIVSNWNMVAEITACFKKPDGKILQFRRQGISRLSMVSSHSKFVEHIARINHMPPFL